MRPEAAVSEARVDLLAAEGLEVGAHGLDAVGDHVADAKVDQVVVEQGAEKELEGEVVHLLGALGVGVGEDGAALVGDELGEGEVALVVGELLEGGAVAGQAGLTVLLDEVLLVLEDLGVVSQNYSLHRGDEHSGARTSPHREASRDLPVGGRPRAASLKLTPSKAISSRQASFLTFPLQGRPSWQPASSRPPSWGRPSWPWPWQPA